MNKAGLRSNEDITNLQGMLHRVVVLRNVSKLFTSTEKELDEILFTLIYMIPEGMRFPEIAAAQIKLDDHIISTKDYENTKWTITVPIKVSGRKVGIIRVSYIKRPPLKSGPAFLEGEKDLIDTIASEMGLYLERFRLRRIERQQKRELEIYASLLRHDLRNDLNVILANVDLAKIVSTDNQVLEAITAIEGACERMINILTIFGQMPIVTENNITSILERSVKQARLTEPHTTITLEIDSAVKNLIISESNLLPMVFDNLLRNAATHAGDKPNVTITVRQKGGFIQVVVADDGPGISNEIKKRLFERGVSTKKGGLGLYLSREIMKSIGGSIQLLDTARGAAFEVLIPIISGY